MYKCSPDESIEDPVERLKTLADCYWHLGEPDQAFRIGQQIIRLGEASSSLSTQGLGYMVCGDASNDQRLYTQAWELLETAARKYTLAEQVGEPDAAFHQARTAIGKLIAAIGADKTAQAQHDFEVAREIFTHSSRSEAFEKLATLHQNAAIFFWRLGQFDAANTACNLVLKMIREDKVSRLGLEPMILLQIGHIYGHQGLVRESVMYFEKALYLCQQDSRLREGVFLAHQNLAVAELSRGLYQDCIERLERHITPELGANSRMLVDKKFAVIECFLALNDYRGAAEIATALVTAPLQADEIAQRGPALFYLATAQAELGMYTQAEENFGRALAIFEAGGLLPKTMLVYLRRAQVRFKQGEYVRAHDEIEKTIPYWIDTGHSQEEADARLLLANIAYVAGDSSYPIDKECLSILQIAETCDSFQLRYATYLLLGHLARQQGDLKRAEQYYRASLEAVDQVQRDLAMTFRPSFLSDKGEALRALVHLFLETDRPDAAFEVIEISRAQVFLRYLAVNHSQGIDEDEATRHLAERLVTLRQDYVALSNIINPNLTFTHGETIEYNESIKNATRDKALVVGRELRDLIRQLMSRHHRASKDDPLGILRLRDLQAHHLKNKTLIAYYDDGKQIIGFVIEEGKIDACILSSTAEIKRLIKSLDVQFNYALSASRFVSKEEAELPGDELLRLSAFNQVSLNRSFESVVGSLYNLLIKPLKPHLHHEQFNMDRSLTIIPFGLLHFVPFHLLFDNVRGRYLFQDRDIATMPTASLIGRSMEVYPPNIVIIYDDLNHKLRHSVRDAEQIGELLSASNSLNGESSAKVQIYNAREALANGVLRKSSGQILHIIAHAEFNELHPELSFIQLDGQPLLMSDLLGYKLDYQLVTLTACQTGRLSLVEREGRGLLGDDLVGLGRAFLYAGARAVLTSRWLVGDGMTLPLLERFYQRLKQGDSLAKALCGAQSSLRHPDEGVPTLHPAFWGLFQLIGDGEARIAYNK